MVLKSRDDKIVQKIPSIQRVKLVNIHALRRNCLFCCMFIYLFLLSTESSFSKCISDQAQFLVATHRFHHQCAKSLDPDEVQRLFGPDLGLTGLQRL